MGYRLYRAGSVIKQTACLAACRRTLSPSPSPPVRESQDNRHRRSASCATRCNSALPNVNQQDGFRRERHDCACGPARSCAL